MDNEIHKIVRDIVYFVYKGDFQSAKLLVETLKCITNTKETK